MSAQLRRSARKRKNLPIVAAASARKKANQRVPDTMSVPAPQLPTVDTGTPFIPVTSSTGTYPMLISQTGAGIYTSASTGPVDLTSTANTLLYSRVPLPDQREYNTVTSQDPPEHSLGNTNGASNFTMPFSTFDHPVQIPSMHANIAFNVSQSIREKIMKSEFIDLGILLANNTQQATQKLVFRGGEFIVQTENLQNKIGSIDQWTSAFIIFVSVYCTVHSGRLQELLKYMSVVRLGAKRNPNNLGWKLYDEQFRLRKALDPASSWAIVDSELWLLYMADSSGTQNLEVVSSGNSNKQDRELLAHLWQLGHTPIRIERLQELLKNYPNREAAEELYLGFSLGFRLQYTGPREHVMSKNLVSAEHFKWETLNKLKTEIELGKPAKIWITGSSLVKNAFIESRQRPGGTNLCLDRLNAEIWWQGKSGMVTSQLRRQIRIMKKYEDPPKFLVVHVGANDLGNIKTKDLREKLIQAMTFISKDLPDTKIVWSQMLPRLKWRYSNDSKAMEKCRYRVNNAVANFILESGGYYIRYPDISRTENMYKSDGVHLSVIGNNIFLNSIQGGLEFFMLKTNGHVFPSTDI
ncbi:unnamed protein product [Mytilus edulis]|uniref:SGNH hydrolase-type esterase domain-containing protein n=1 Tax=Mytilus edulis TaxID=6550 RepID=A0A8S3VK90_MYTED|nr:unnamed protein product [Mytilus edulis]